jgi:hypothetical protein
MINDYPIKKYIIKKKFLISYLYVETKWKSYECNTCSNYELAIFNEGVSITINFNLIIYI